MTTTDHKKKKTDVLHSHLRVWGLGQTLANRKPERRCNKGIVPPARRNDKTENCLIGMPAMPDDKLWITCFLCVPYFTSYVYWNIYIYMYIYIYSIYVITIWVCLTYLSGTCWPGSSAMGSKGKCLKYSWDEQLHWWKSCNCSWWQKIIMMAMKYTWNTFQLKPGTMQLFK